MKKVSEVAQAIGLHDLGLRLLNYLDQYHPNLALDYEFIMQRADHAAEVRSRMERDGNFQEADWEANSVLMAGLEFSRHSIIFDIVDNYYARTDCARQPAEVKKIAIELQPQVDGIFSKYPTEDAEFTASCEYDDMIIKLTKAAEKSLQKRDELPF
jgi:hypothetical protein